MEYSALGYFLSAVIVIIICLVSFLVMIRMVIIVINELLVVFTNMCLLHFRISLGVTLRLTAHHSRHNAIHMVC